MSDCCNGILNLGCVNSCEDICTGITAAVTGLYIMELNGIQIVGNTIPDGDEICFTGGYLNEDMTTIFKIIKPDGTYLTSGENDCFRVTTSPAYNTEGWTPAPIVSLNCLQAYNFTTNNAQQTYTMPAAMQGKTIVQIEMGEAIVPVGDYGFVYPTLTFANFVVQGTLNCVVYYR